MLLRNIFIYVIATSSFAASCQGDRLAVASSPERIHSLHVASDNEIKCLALPEEDSDFGSITKEDWESWIGDVWFVVGTEFLAVEGARDNKRTLRQKLVPHPRGTDRVLAGINIPSARSYRLTQSVYLEPGFEYGGKNEGGKLGFGFGGGSAPSGGVVEPDGFTARFMWRGNKDGTAHIVMYSYASDRHMNLPWGDSYPLEHFLVPIGEWFELSLEITANSSTDRADGSARAWVNGELSMQRNDIVWQSDGSTPMVEYLFYAAFYGGNDASWSPDKTTFIRFADVCWSPVIDGESGINPGAASRHNQNSTDDSTRGNELEG